MEPEPNYILVVDDDNLVRDLVVYILTRITELPIFDFAEVQSAQQHISENGLPRLAVLDVQIGTRNGFDLARSIREKSQDVPVLMMTGDQANKAQYTQLALQLGIELVWKPFEVSTFESKINLL